MAYKFQIGAAKLSGSTQFNDRVDVIGDIDLSASSIDSVEIAELNAFDTDDLSEGSSNLYYTDARVRAAVSAVDAGGDGSFAYDSATGAFTYTGPSAAEARAHLSADGDLVDYNSTTGVISTNATNFSASWDVKMAAADTGDLAEGSNLYHTTARARGAISVTDAGGDGSLAYNSSTGVLTYTGPSSTEVRAHLSSGYMIDFASGEFSIDAAEFSGSWDAVLATKNTGDLAEGSNLYFTDARARAAISVDDVSGDGSLSYNSTSGVISYTGPSAAEVRAHLSAGNMLDFSAGQFSVNASAFSASWDAALATKDTGDLAEGSNLYHTTARVRAALSDADVISYNSSTGVIGIDASAMSASIEAASQAYFSGGNMVDISAAGVVSVNAADFSGSWDAAMAADDTDSLSEGSTNLYYLDSRARAAISVTDAGGDGSLSYDNSTGVITYTGPSASEVRAHISAGTGVAINSGVISIGQAVATSDSVTFASGTFSGDLTVAGDLEVQGALTYLNTTNLEIQDNEIVLNKGGNLGAGATSGLRLEDGSGQDMIFQWEGTDGQFELLDASGAYQNLKLDNLIASTVDFSAGGAVLEGIQTIAASAGTTAVAQKSIIMVGKANTVTLPAVADMPGLVFKIKNNDDACGVGADAIIIAAASGESIEGVASIRLESPSAAIMVVSDGSDWFVM